MKVSLKWLKEFIDFKNISNEKIVNLFNNRTMEVEKVIHYSKKLSFKNIVVGEIKTISNHPSSDNFGIAEVYVGETVGTKRIVFTKSGLDISVGERPLIATKGAVFDSGLKIRDKAIFGVVSEAAFCSEKDLGMDLNISSIVKFPKEEVGRTAYDIFDLDDTVLEFDLEPNRPDLFGITGFVYELSAMLNQDAVLPELYNDIEITSGKFHTDDVDKLNIKIENKDIIPSYIAVKINNINIKESNGEIRNKLIKSGIRPINNVVDLTNVVMLELSQPLHAFDAKKIGRTIIVRLSEKGEKVSLLDGKERNLEGGDILIESDGRIIALAGIMGGLNSGIGESSDSIVVESANFNMSAIRKTSRTLSLRTDASTRFEKGIHPSVSIQGIKRFIYLVKKYIPEAIIECLAYDIKAVEKPLIYKIKHKDLSEFLGEEEEIDKKTVLSILSRLGYDMSGKNCGEADDFEVIPPYFRNDITDKVNIYEDIFRIYGYENIKSTLPYGALIPPLKNINYETARIFKSLLNCAGFIEVINPALVGDKEIKISGARKGEILELKNPISIDYAYFRTSLIPDILRVYSQNSKRYKNIKIYEIGKTYKNITVDDYPVSERNFLCGLISNGIKQEKQETEFYTGKSIVESILKEAGIKRFSYSKIEDDSIFDKSASLEIYVGKQRLGIFGEIRRNVLEEYKIDSKIFVFEIDIDAAKDFISQKKVFIQPSKYPDIEQDISIIASADTEYEKIEKFIKNFSGIIKNIRLVSVYRGKQIEEGKISFLIRYDAISDVKTLTMDEVNILRDDLLKNLNEKFGIALRT